MSIKTNTLTGEVRALKQVSGLIMTPFLTHALNISRRGWHVFPLKPLDKTPLTPNGYKNATTDTTQIIEWMKKYPTANIGVATEVSGLLVIDCVHPNAE